MRYAVIGLVAWMGISGLGAQKASAGGRTREELVAFIERAAEYVRTHPRDEALRELSSPMGQFTFGDLYVFAFNFEGTCLANGERPAMIGKNVIKLTDRTGYPVVQNLVNAAKPGKGFIEYMWDNPATKLYEKKLTYVLKIDEGMFIGGGIYLGVAKVVPLKR